MRQALRNRANGQNGSHAGLILARYWVADSQPESKKTLYKSSINAVKESQAVYQLAFDRWQKALQDVAEIRNFTIDGRMVIGLGASNVLETGITLHQTYGVPYIPGSALKGLCAHYALESGIDEKHRNLIFGKTDEAGMVQFYDAWLEPESLKSCLVRDVMTPHHSDYYGSKEDVPPPSEFDSPVPVPFLSVTGTFSVALSCEDGSERGKKWLNFVWQLLEKALAEKGIGGKTNSGYGFGILKTPPPPPKKEYERVKKLL